MLYFLAVLGPYNFCNAEKMDGIANFNHKNLINCKIMKFAKIWMQFIKIMFFPAIVSIFSPGMFLISLMFKWEV